MTAFLSLAVIYLLAAVLAVPVAARLGLGSVLGYLAAGIVIGPVLNLVGNETQDLQHFAEFGVVMMLFVIGLELAPRTLWDMRHKLLGLGGLQVLGTMGVIAAIACAFGQPWQSSLAIGMVLALSSTAIVLQTLTEKGLIQTAGGRSSFSVLLTQDVAVIPMLALIPLLALPELTGLSIADADHHGPAHDPLAGRPGWVVTLATLGAISAIILMGIYAMRPIFHFVHSTRLREMSTAITLLIVTGIAYLMILVGLSPALGTFLAGVVLANSEFRHELESDIEPFKGLLLGLFFITVGAGINFDVFAAQPWTIAAMTLGVIVIKAGLLFGLSVIFRIRGRNRWLFTLSLAQAGEFGFVLLAFSTKQHVIAPALAEQLLLVVALSMLVTPLLFMLYDHLSRRARAGQSTDTPDDIDSQGPVIIAGIGRFGQIVNRLVRNSGIETVVLDNDPKTIDLMRKFGIKGFFGDPTRPEILHAAGIDRANILVVAVDDPDAAVKLVTYARTHRPNLHIIARAKDRAHVYRLYAAGANDIVREMFDSSLRAGRYVLEHAGLTEYEAAEAEQAFYKHDRYALQELAKLWNPTIPLAQNQAYIERANQLEQELESSLLAARVAPKGGD